MSFTITDGVFVKSRSGVGNEELVEIPDGVTAVGEGAFEGESCKSISVPLSVARIGSRAFAFCENLRGITLSEGLAELGDNVFCGCKRLCAVHFPSTLVAVDKKAELFDGCDALSSITVADGNPAYHADGDCLIEIDSRRLLGGCKSSVIPDDGSVAEIAAGAFLRISGLKKLAIPASVVGIGDRAFFGCRELTAVELPPSVRSIGAEAYRVSGAQRVDLGCVTRIGYAAFESSSLTAVELPDSVRAIGRIAFAYCDIKRLRVGRGLKDIPEGAFKHNYGLTEVELCDGPTAIDKDAFAYCESLERIVVPRSVAYIGKGAFRGCKALREVTVENPDAVVAEDAFSGCIYKHVAPEQKPVASDFECKGSTLMKYIGSEKRVVIPDFVTKLSGKPFAKNTAVEEIFIPRSVASVAVHSFDGCENLVGLTVDGDNKRLRSEGNCIIDKKTNTLVVGCNGSVLPRGGIAAIGASAFEGCRRLERADIPQGVETVGSNAFSKCARLESVVFPCGLISVESGAFSGCKRLVGAAFGRGLRSIGDEAFKGCAALGTLAVAEIEEIGARAFFGCAGLGRVDLPEGLRSIGGQAFGGCAGLISISLPSTLSELGGGVFPSGPLLESIAVADGNPAYSGKGNCIVHLGEKYGEPYYRVIYGCKNTVIPSDMGISAIDGAFVDCVGLTELDIPNGVTHTFGAAFGGCTGLKRLSVPDSLGYFEIFGDCVSLEHVCAPKRMWEYFGTLNPDIELEER